jgi:hypothetical protein
MRTTNLVQRDLIGHKASRNPLTGNPYLDCRFTPFAAHPTRMGPPDGQGKRILIRDWKAVFDLDYSAPSRMRITPTYPFPVRFWSTGGVTCNGIVIPALLCSNLWGATLDPGQMAVDWPGLNVINKQDVVAARVISVGYRLMYTGTATNAAGLIIADDIGYKVDIKTRANTDAMTFLDKTGTAVAIAAGGVATVTVDEIGLNTQAQPTTFQYVGRPELGVEGVLRSQATATNGIFQSWHELGIAPIIDNGSPGSTQVLTVSQTTAFTGATTPGYTVLDDSFMAAYLETTIGGTYRLEVAFCMEWELQSTSALADMGKPSPYRDNAVLELADKLDSMMMAHPLGEMPIPVPSIGPGPRSRRRRRRGGKPKKPVPVQRPKPKSQRKRKQRK